MTKIAKLIQAGARVCRHVYMQTMTSHEESQYDVEVPKFLAGIARNNPDSKLVVYTDTTLGIKLDDQRTIHEDSRLGRRLPKDVWLYCHLAIDPSFATYAE
jgi:hypothetical protein